MLIFATIDSATIDFATTFTGCLDFATKSNKIVKGGEIIPLWWQDKFPCEKCGEIYGWRNHIQSILTMVILHSNTTTFTCNTNYSTFNTYNMIF